MLFRSAARGGDGRLFPWGDDHDDALANVSSNGALARRAPNPVKAFEKGASPYGALQMVGNVWEFVDQLSSPGPLALEYFRKTLDPPPDPGEPWYSIRGVSFDRPLVEGALYDWTTVPARWRDGNIGFRCAKDP